MDDAEMMRLMQVGADNSDRIRAAIRENRDNQRRQMRDWAADFIAALSEAAEAVPGLLFRIPPGQDLPSLAWEGDTRGAYWASAGLVDRGSGDLSQVSATLRYLREPADDGPFERDEYPLATFNIGTRDPSRVAALLVAAAQHHRASLFDTER
jgi:hypothetical protein